MIILEQETDIIWTDEDAERIIKEISPPSPNGLFTLTNNQISYSNLNFAKLLNYSEISGIINRRIEEFVYPIDLEDFLGQLNRYKNNPNENGIDLEKRFIKKNGDIIWLNLLLKYYKLKDNSSRLVFRAIDITKKRKTELMLLQSHRLASVGELTAGVAHEINNPLFGIINYAALIKDTIDEGGQIETSSEEYEFLLGIVEEAERISKIIGNLSEFSRKTQDKEFKPTNLIAVMNKVGKLLSYQIRHAHVNLLIDIQEDSMSEIMLQQYRMEHVLFNLILNSIQALENTTGRKRKIEVKIRIDDSTDINTLNIIIWDNGEGISDENLIKLFNPFFTTRRGIKGTGLGLHEVYLIVNDHNGLITVDSQFGEWSQFEINIPVEYPKNHQN